MRTRRLMLTMLFLVLGLLSVTGAWAQTIPSPTPQFDVLGFIQEATLDTGTGGICTPAPQSANGTAIDVSRLRGGTMTVNGIKMIIPCNTILQLPAATMTWADLFDPAQNAPVGSYIGFPAVPVPANPVAGGLVPKTGLALADNPMPFPSFEVRVQGNVLPTPSGLPEYVVGLIVPITQQGLNSSSGLISYIDYTIGAFRVGGIANDPACAANGITSPLCSGALVQINDPVVGGRWGLQHSPDPRFSGDFNNSTIHASTGIPVCIPRVAPPANDPLCPLSNRPLNGVDLRFPVDPFIKIGDPLKTFTMPAPVLDPATGLNTVTPDPYQQVPMMVGDQVVYAGTLYKINPLATIVDPATGATIPDNTPANTYISAHTLEDNLGIFTAPGVPPAYVYVESFLIGTDGAAQSAIPFEASTRLTAVGFTTDPTRLVEIYARDVNPCTGQETLRQLATTDPATQAVVGRFVHRVLGGNFMPPTRNYTIRSQTQAIDPVTFQRVDLVAANGILTGEFSLPNFEYIFAETHAFGFPFVSMNFQDMPFLAQGSGPINGPVTATNPASAVVGQLDPWPGVPAPTPATCGALGAAPVVNAGPDIAVATGAAVTLTGTVTWDSINSLPGSRIVQWAQTGGTVVTGTQGGTLTAPTFTFTAPNTAQALAFTLTAIDNIAIAPGVSDTVNITVLAPADIVQITAATWVTATGKRGGFGKLNVTATSSDPTAILTLQEIGVDGSVNNWGTGVQSPSAPGIYNWVEIKGAPQPASLTVTSSKGGSATTGCGAPTGNKGTVTCP